MKTCYARIRLALMLGIAVFVAAILFRTFFILGILEPIEISAGSMAPTYLGPHSPIDCETCGENFAIGYDRPLHITGVDCPFCGAPISNVPAAPTNRGESIWIDRAAFDFSPPKRWEAVVFRHPQDSQSLWIKRIVGLPGETISIDAGDIFVNDERIVKTLPEQMRLRQLMLDAPHADLGWKSTARNSSWHFERNSGWQWNAVERPENNTIDALEFFPLRASQSRKMLLDDIPYNAGESRQLNEVPDIMLELAGEFPGNGRWNLDVYTGMETFHIEFDFQQGSIAIQKNGAAWLEAISIPKHSGAKPVRQGILLSLFDRNFLLQLNGKMLVDHPIPKSDAFPIPNTPPPVVSITSHGVSIRDLEISVWRDIYYTRLPTGARPLAFDADSAEKPWHLPADHYFLLGDNSPISEDSRTFPSPGVARKLFLGRPLRAPW